MKKAFNPLEIRRKTKFLTGFTLVELVILLMVLSVGLVTLLLVIRNASINNATAHLMTVAGSLAEGEMEKVLATRRESGFGAINNYTDTFDGYNIEVDVYYVRLGNLDTPVSGSSDYKRVEVTVSKPGIDIGISMVTVVSNY